MEKKALMEMIKCVAVLVAISLLAGILLAVANNYTYIEEGKFDTSDFDSVIAAQTSLGAQTWSEVKNFDALDPKIRTTTSGDSEIMGYAISSSGVLGMKAKGTGFAAPIYITMVIGSDGVVAGIAVDAAETKGSDSNYGGSAKFKDAILGKPVGSLGMVRGVGTPAADEVNIVVGGASVTSGVMAKIFNLMFRYIKVKELVSLDDPREAFITYVNGLQTGLTVEVTDLDVASGFGYFDYAMENGDYIVYIKGNYEQAAVVIFDTDANEIAAVGAFGYAADVTASVKTALEGIDFNGATLPSEQIDDIDRPTAAGADQDAYDLVEALCILMSNPDSANDTVKGNVITTFELDAETEILTIYSALTPELSIGTAAPGTYATIQYAGVLTDGSFVFVVDTTGYEFAVASTLYIMVAADGEILDIRYPNGVPAEDEPYVTNAKTYINGLVSGTIDAAITSSATLSYTRAVIQDVFTVIKNYLASGLNTAETGNVAHKTAINTAYAGVDVITLYGEILVGDERYIGTDKIGDKPLADIEYVGVLSNGYMVFGVKTTANGEAPSATIYVFVDTDGKIAKVTYSNLPASGGDPYESNTITLMNGLLTNSLDSAITIVTGSSLTDTGPVIKAALELVKDFLA